MSIEPELTFNCVLKKLDIKNEMKIFDFFKLGLIPYYKNGSPIPCPDYCSNYIYEFTPEYLESITIIFPEDDPRDYPDNDDKKVSWKNARSPNIDKISHFFRDMLSIQNKSNFDLIKELEDILHNSYYYNKDVEHCKTLISEIQEPEKILPIIWISTSERLIKLLKELQSFNFIDSTLSIEILLSHFEVVGDESKSNLNEKVKIIWKKEYNLLGYLINKLLDSDNINNDRISIRFSQHFIRGNNGKPFTSRNITDMRNKANQKKPKDYKDIDTIIRVINRI